MTEEKYIRLRILYRANKTTPQWRSSADLRVSAACIAALLNKFGTSIHER